MNRKLRIGLAALILALAACQAPDAADPGPGSDLGPAALRLVPQADKVSGDSLARISDPYRIDSAGVEGDSLIAWVSMGGGCREHAFTLYASDYIYISKPSGLDLWLRHEGHGDPCEARLQRRLAFGLDAIRGLDPEGFLLLNRHPSDSGPALRIAIL